VRRERDEVTHIAMAEGTYVDVDGVRLLEVQGGRATVAVDGSTVDVSAPVASTSRPFTLPATGGPPPPGPAGAAAAAVFMLEVLRRRAGRR